ncbi:hypothetical protein [Rhizobium vallis]|nr:hypothetical protein [Rhizobium vallis]
METVLCCETQKSTRAAETEHPPRAAAVRMLGRIAVTAAGKPEFCLRMSI